MAKAKKIMVMGLVLLMVSGVGLGTCYSRWSNGMEITPRIDPPSGNPNLQ